MEKYTSIDVYVLGAIANEIKRSRVVCHRPGIYFLYIIARTNNIAGCIMHVGVYKFTEI